MQNIKNDNSLHFTLAIFHISIQYSLSSYHSPLLHCWSNEQNDEEELDEVGEVERLTEWVFSV